MRSKHQTRTKSQRRAGSLMVQDIRGKIRVMCPLCGAYWFTAATHIGTVIVCVKCGRDIHPVEVEKK